MRSQKRIAGMLQEMKVSTMGGRPPPAATAARERS
jgi:hypothetical protein